jgi:hypothetical protein
MIVRRFVVAFVVPCVTIPQICREVEMPVSAVKVVAVGDEGAPAVVAVPEIPTVP